MPLSQAYSAQTHGGSPLGRVSRWQNGRVNLRPSAELPRPAGPTPVPEVAEAERGMLATPLPVHHSVSAEPDERESTPRTGHTAIVHSDVSNSPIITPTVSPARGAFPLHQPRAGSVDPAPSMRQLWAENPTYISSAASSLDPPPERVGPAEMMMMMGEGRPSRQSQHASVDAASSSAPVQGSSEHPGADLGVALRLQLAAQAAANPAALYAAAPGPSTRQPHARAPSRSHAQVSLPPAALARAFSEGNDSPDQVLALPSAITARLMPGQAAAGVPPSTLQPQLDSDEEDVEWDWDDDEDVEADAPAPGLASVAAAVHSLRSSSLRRSGAAGSFVPHGAAQGISVRRSLLKLRGGGGSRPTSIHEAPQGALHAAGGSEVGRPLRLTRSGQLAGSSRTELDLDEASMAAEALDVDGHASASAWPSTSAFTKRSVPDTGLSDTGLLPATQSAPEPAVARPSHHRLGFRASLPAIEETLTPMVSEQAPSSPGRRGRRARAKVLNAGRLLRVDSLNHHDETQQEGGQRSRKSAWQSLKSRYSGSDRSGSLQGSDGEPELAALRAEHAHEHDAPRTRSGRGGGRRSMRSVMVAVLQGTAASASSAYSVASHSVSTSIQLVER